MDAVYPVAASALARGRRLRRGSQRARTRTQPVTFAEIEEVDEESEQAEQGAGARRRSRRDELTARGEPAGAGGELPAGPRVRARRRARDIPEPPEEGSSSGAARASSEPRAAPDL